MILKKIYDENTKTQRVWYDSSMIAYTEMVEDEFENKGDLYVTFKNGSTYVYKDVSLSDYVLFVGGGTDASQGKALNKIIKSKYEFEKGAEKNVTELFEEMERLSLLEMEANDVSNTYCIFGEDDYTDIELEINYWPIINKLISDDVKFLICGESIFDLKVQDYLFDVIGLDSKSVIIYHQGESANFINTSAIEFVNGYDDEEKMFDDMILKSADSIAFVRTANDINKTSRNILKRNLLTTIG